MLMTVWEILMIVWVLHHPHPRHHHIVVRYVVEKPNILLQYAV